MKKNIIGIIFGITFPCVAFAQATVTINPNLPGVQDVATSGPCGWIVGFYLFCMIAGGVLAFGSMVLGGFKYATSAGNPHGQGDAKSYIWSSLVGLLLLGGAYIILTTINPSFGQCSLPALSPIQTPSGAGGGFTPPGLGGANGGETSAAALQQLSAAGISLKSGASVEGIQSNTVKDLQNLASQCAQAVGVGCNIVITSATDGTHAEGACSHANGYKADLRPSASLDSFVMSLPYAGVRRDGATLYAFNGGFIADERNLPGVGAHWDLSAVCP